jgi:hypothetical protein
MCLLGPRMASVIGFIPGLRYCCCCAATWLAAMGGRVHRTVRGWVRRWLPLLLAPPALLALLFNGWEFASLWIEHDHAFEEAQAQTQALSRDVSRALAAILGPVDVHITDHLKPVATRFVQSQASVLQLQRVFLLTAQRLPQVAAVVVYDAGGRAVAGSVPLVRPAQSVAGGFFFQRHRDQALDSGLFVADAAQSVADAGPVRWRLHLSRRLQDLDGRFVGVVRVQLDTEHVFTQLAGLNLVPGMVVRVFDAAGRLLVNHPRDYSKAGRNFWESRLFRRWAAKGGELAGRLPDPTDDTPEVGVLRPVEGYPLLVSVGVSEDTALVEWWRELAILLATVGLFLAASALAARKPIAKWVLHLNGKGEDDRGFTDGDGI